MELEKYKEYTHEVVDSVTDEKSTIVVRADSHGLTVEFENGQIITIDLSREHFSIYHNQSTDYDSEILRHINMKKN
jgi:plasmid stability protein